jgi:hypothetical protein
MGFVREEHSVHCEVRTDISYKTQINFSLKSDKGYKKFGSSYKMSVC